MNIPTPNNDSEAGYIAFALVDGLIDLLAEKDLIGRRDIGALIDSVVVRLAQGNSIDQNRASRFLANRVKLEP
jgi:hypothetical protein